MSNQRIKQHCFATHAYGTDNILCFRNKQDLDDAWRGVTNCAARGYVTRNDRVIVTEKYAAFGGLIANKGLDLIPWPVPHFPVEEDARRAEDFLRENAAQQRAQ